jgi:hypothetical protein
MLVGPVPGRGTDDVGAAHANNGAATALSICGWLNADPPPLPGVVALAEALCADSTPAESTAVTVYVCELPAARPLIVALVVLGDATTVVPSYTLYEAAGSLLLDSVHDKSMLELLAAVAVSPVGVAGVVVPPVGVVAVADALCADALPAESTATTVYVCELPAARPLIVALVVVGEATTTLPSYTLYEAAGSLLLDSVHDKSMLELLAAVAVSPVGVAGAVAPPP